MRIALNGRFYAGRVTGVQRFAREVAARLRTRDDVVVLVPGDAPADGDAVRGRLRGHVWEQAELPWRVRAERCDVCVSLAGTLPGTGGPHVAVVHDVLPLTNPEWFSPAFATWYRLAVGRNAKRAARVVTVSRWSAGRIHETLGVPVERIVVAGQGVAPFDAPSPPEAIASECRRLGILDHYILAVGWGDPRKNIAFLARVMREWRRRDAAAPTLVVVGRPTKRVHGEPEAIDAVLVRDADDESLRALYSGASALAFPSHAEGFGRPPLEAACCGTPSVVAPYGAAVEVLGDGALVASLDVDAWIGALGRVMHDASLRRDLVRRGQAAARSRTWQDAADVVHAACVEAAREGGA